MSRTEREKALEKAMRRLTPVFMRKLSADIRHELYGRDQLTWMEYERIGRPPVWAPAKVIDSYDWDVCVLLPVVASVVANQAT